MKIFSWMQSKLSSKQENKISNSLKNNVHQKNLQESPKDEFSDWHHGLLAIGTFGIGNNTPNLKEDEENLEKELKLLLEKAESTSEEGKEEEEFEKCEDSLEENIKINALQQSNSVVIGRGKDNLCGKNSNKGKNGIIGKKSVSFLLKKMFLCRSGLSSTSSFRDSFPDPRLDKSRMEKVLRAILHKKIYPQSTTPKSSVTNPKKYLQNNEQISTCESDQEDAEKQNEHSKWVKTDSEYIVLEI